MLQELILTVNILRNMLCGNEAVKVGWAFTVSAISSITYHRSCLSALFHTHCADNASSSFTAAVQFAIGWEHSTVQFATAGWEQFAIAG